MNYKMQLLSFKFLCGMLFIPTMTYANINIIELTAEQAQKDLKSNRYTSKELTLAFLSRIKAYNPYYNAIITLNENALKEAEAIDQRRANGETLGPLAGIPVVIKDTIDMKGFPTTAGWAPLSHRAGGTDLIPDKDAPVISRLKDAGAIILGKTNVPILSISATNANNSWAGTTYNAVSYKHSPGGSSSGTATAVSGNFAILGLAEETGGSIQNPAAAQALVSIKPTFALIPNTGVFPLATSTRDVIGPHTKTVYDAALMLDILAGYTLSDPKTIASVGKVPDQGYVQSLEKATLKGKRIGIYGIGWRNTPLSKETQQLYEKVLDELRQQGATIVLDPFKDSSFSSIAQLTPTPGIGGYDFRGSDSIAYDLQQYLQNLGPNAKAQNLEQFKLLVKQDPFENKDLLAYIQTQPNFAESLKNPSKPPELKDFLKAKHDYIRIFNQVMDEQQLDALVFPQMLQETPELFSSDVIKESTVSEINIGGFPAITVPAGYYKSGSAFSLIFIGRLWDEANLLSYAYVYEQSTQHRKAPILVNKIENK